jgi:hypothetical protein
MENSVMCPMCDSTSLSANKIEVGEIEITCMNCGATFKPGEGVTSFREQKKGIGYIIAGYCFAILCILLLPVIFLPLAIVCGLACIVEGRYRIIHGIVIIVIAMVLSKYGVLAGGWGLGITYRGFLF